MAQSKNVAKSEVQVDLAATAAHIGGVVVDTDDLMLAGLLDQLGEDDGILESVEASDADLLDGLGEEIIEAAGADEALDAAGDEPDAAVVSDEEAIDNLLEEVGADAERAQAKHALYAEQEIKGVSDGQPPATDAAAITDVDTGKKPKKAKTAKEPKEPKEHRATSVTHKPGDLLKIKLGAKADEFLTFDLKDADLDPEALVAKQEAFVARMNSDTDATKVKEKLVMFMTWLMNGGTLNTVMARALEVLAKDGQLTSGDKGNLQLNLLAKPLSLGTSRSQSNQIFMLFPILELTVKEKGRMIPNPDSALLPLAYSLLSL